MKAHRDGKFEHVNVSYTAYTPDEIEAAWHDCDGQGHGHAVNGYFFCVNVHDLTKEQAIELAGLFVRNVFAIPSCTYYSERYRTLNLYCGDAGSGADHALRSTERLVAEWRAGVATPAYGPLWLTEEELERAATTPARDNADLGPASDVETPQSSTVSLKGDL